MAFIGYLLLIQTDNYSVPFVSFPANPEYLFDFHP